MTTDERIAQVERGIARLERATACLATNLARRGPLRGDHVAAVREIVAEITELDGAMATESRREALRAELAELEAA